MRVSWDIFCSVVDNYGDIGVTWRLARQLVAEHDLDVRLWIDDLTPFCKLCPAAELQHTEQRLEGVRVYHWPAEWQPVAAADVVIEAFACQLPSAYIAAMSQREQPALWLNLEYLSAENWVEGCHGLPSLQANGLQKFFFFPGFTPKTGGLLRETGLLEQRHYFQKTPGVRTAFLRQLGIKALPNTLLISLFAYENPALDSWLDALANADQPSHLLVPEGRIVSDLNRWLGCDSIATGELQIRGSLSIQQLPFLSQQDYDRLLWSCDLNAVRGEDSFVRAQWAGRPFLWHIYPQQQDTHLDKLDAFLNTYIQGLSPTAQNALQTQWLAWNGGDDMQPSWEALLSAWPELENHAENWCQQQSQQTNIAAALVQFYLNWL